MRDREALLRRRVHQCFTAIGFSSIAESTQTVLLQSVVMLLPALMVTPALPSKRLLRLPLVHFLQSGKAWIAMPMVLPSMK